MTKHFKGQIISDEQANRMLSLSHQLDWDYGKTYEKFYAFMETVSEEERAVIIRALATYHRERKENAKAFVDYVIGDKQDEVNGDPIREDE